MEKFRQSDGKSQSEFGIHLGSPPDTPQQQPTAPDDAKTEESIPMNQQKVEQHVEPNNQEIESESSVSLDNEDDAESQASTMYLMKVIGGRRHFNVKKKEANRILRELSPDVDGSSGESESKYSISLDDEEEEEKMPSGKQVSDGDVSDEQSGKCMDEKSGSPQESERTASSMYLMKVIKDEQEESPDEKSIKSENDEEERSSPPESERFVAFSPMEVIREQSVISDEDGNDDNLVNDGRNANPTTPPHPSRDTETASPPSKRARIAYQSASSPQN